MTAARLENDRERGQVSAGNSAAASLLTQIDQLKSLVRQSEFTRHRVEVQLGEALAQIKQLKTCVFGSHLLTRELVSDPWHVLASRSDLAESAHKQQLAEQAAHKFRQDAEHMQVNATVV